MIDFLKSVCGRGRKRERNKVRGREENKEWGLLAFHQQCCDQYQCLTGQRSSLYRKSLPIMMEPLNHTHNNWPAANIHTRIHTQIHIHSFIQRPTSAHTNIRYLCPKSAFPKTGNKQRSTGESRKICPAVKWWPTSVKTLESTLV